MQNDQKHHKIFSIVAKVTIQKNKIILLYIVKNYIMNTYKNIFHLRFITLKNQSNKGLFNYACIYFISYFSM